MGADSVQSNEPAAPGEQEGDDGENSTDDADRRRPEVSA